MTPAAFLDTVHILALLNARDSLHEQALVASQNASGKLVTTEAILMEVADALALPATRRWAVEAIQDIRNDPDVTCLPVEGALFARAFELYTQRPDKAWSLTDCISFVVMKEMHLTDALTADVHFEQAGFRALLRN